jgi:adenine C2-methylase RlmN of 23S rRNA A2503 and tRNA A37
MSKFKKLGRFRDIDGTEKYVFQTSPGVIELTSIKNKPGVGNFCIPSHHYCRLGCKFCHLTEEGNQKKPMIPIKIHEMATTLDWVVDRYIKDDKILFSFMGVGEPTLNIDLVFQLYKHFKKTDKTVSMALATMMLLPAAYKKILVNVKKNNLPLKIHFSMHSPFNDKRKAIIPSAITTIEECLERLAEYRKIVEKKPAILENLSLFHQKPDPVEIHYTIIKDANDSDEELKRLLKYGGKYKIPLKILKFNPTNYLDVSPRTKHWLKVLDSEYAAPVYHYDPPGHGIGSSCGQFTKHYYLGSKTKQLLEEFHNWKKKYQITWAN